MRCRVLVCQQLARISTSCTLHPSESRILPHTASREKTERDMPEWMMQELRPLVCVPNVSPCS